MSVYLEMQIDEMADEITALKALNQKLQLEKNALKEQLILSGVSGSESSSIRIFKLECLTEDGNMETNGYYKTIEAAELKKAELDKYPMNLQYSIKQQIVEIDLED